MSNPAHDLSTDEVMHSYATVLSAGESLLVRYESGLSRARKAVSCVVEPAVGDRVLITSDSRGETYIVAVLARTGAAPIRMSVDGDLSLEARGGKLSLVAGAGLELGTSGSVEIVSKSLDIHSVNGNVSIMRLSFIGSFLHARIETIRVVAEAFHSLIEAIHQQARRVFRRVDEIEQLKARHLDYRADEGISMHGKYLLVTAAQVVKVDGEQIQLG